MKIKNKKLIRNILIVAGIILAVALILMLIGNKMKADVIKAQQEAENYSKWLSGNCGCLERNKPVCTLDGFEYNSTRNLCVNSAEKKITFSSLGCSKYNCSGEIKLWNNETEKWGNKTN